MAAVQITRIRTSLTCPSLTKRAIHIRRECASSRTEGSSLSVKLLLDRANLSLPTAKLGDSWSWLCEAAIL